MLVNALLELLAFYAAPLRHGAGIFPAKHSLAPNRFESVLPAIRIVLPLPLQAE